MTKNPLINAGAAVSYIGLIVGVMSWGTRNMRGEDSFLAPMTVISLFTLSAAVMAYLFCYQPIQMYFDGKKKSAVRLFLQTVAAFGVWTAAVMGMMFAGSWSK